GDEGERGGSAEIEALVLRVRGVLGASLGEDAAGADGLQVSVGPLHAPAAVPHGARHLVTVLAPDLGAAAMAGMFSHVAAAGGNVERIERLASYPVTSYQLEVTGADPVDLRRLLAGEAARLEVDVAVQQAGLHRRAKHLIVLDADSTLLRGEVIDLLAARVGCAEEVAAVTSAAMAGELDFAESLERRLSLLEGTDERELLALREDLVLAPGARTLVRTLRRLGYVTAVVSGGFVQVIEPLAAELGIDYVAANRLEVVDGRLTGRLVGPLVDRPGKAAALRRFADLAGVPLAQTVAVGDGANDLDMLATAGLGVAFNAKPVVRDAADAALNVPYLDAILFVLGISREEIEAADRIQAGPPPPAGVPAS
ncbi:MAG: phosphoserine phosphatase SerB, partial [Acidimicrobiales bacterium]